MVEERKDSELNESEARNKRKYVVRMRNVAMMVLHSWRGRGGVVLCGGGSGGFMSWYPVSYPSALN